MPQLWRAAGMGWQIRPFRHLFLLRQLVRRLASFWAISPHPPVYRALADGEFHIGGQKLPFRKGQEIVWACPMTRDRFDLTLPALIADFQGARVQKLCGEMVNAMQGRMG
ncbi:MAG TPA: hypothetical protein ENJ93_04480 [Chloroflexi bacterium]|nr:hypothetical protein [Chloroflexota bacterium]